MKKAKWEIHSERFISFIDLMGFKDYLNKTSNIEAYNRMLSIVSQSSMIKKVVNEMHETLDNGKELLKTTVFSDSIILYTKDDSEIAANAIFYATINLYNYAIMQSIPLKGALSQGMLSVDEKNNLLIGQPLIDAYYLQEEVCYYGIVADNKIDRFLERKNVDNTFKLYFAECETPMKSNHSIHLNLNCLPHNMKENNKKDKYVMQKKEMILAVKKIRQNVTGKARNYIDNTLMMIEKMNPILIEMPYMDS